MVAKLVAFEFQATLLVISLELPSEKMPLAAKACVWPVAIEAVAGVTRIDCNCAAVIVAIEVPVDEPRVAVIVDDPAETPVTRPVELTEASAFCELQVTWLVTSCDVPLLYTPSAESCLLCPDAMENAAGEIVMEETVGAVTVMFPDPTSVPIVALTVTEPAFKPVKPPVALTEPTVGSETPHSTCVVNDCVLLSEYTPVAVSCSIPPTARLGDGVPTLIAVSEAEVTVTPAVPETEFIEAVMVTVPALSEVSIPELLTEATVLSELCQVTWLEIVWVDWSLYVPCALSCSLVPAANDWAP